MRNVSLLLLVGKSCQPAEMGGLIDQARTQSLFLSVIVVGDAPAFPVYSSGLGELGAPIFTDDWRQRFDTAHAALVSTGTAISQHLAAQGVEHNVSIICAEPAVTSETVARRALVCDLVLLSDDLRGTPELFSTVAQAALFRAPAAVVMNAVASASALAPERVLVAWRPAKASARAVHAAMPILRDAREIALVVVDPVIGPMSDGAEPGADAARWLSHQGCKVTVQQYPSGGQDVGHVLMRHAREMDAELIVMGGYDHSRLRETVFGGTTRTLLEQRDLPVLMAH